MLARSRSAVAAVAVAGLLAGTASCAGSDDLSSTPSQAELSSVSGSIADTSGKGVVVVAVGDIACPPGARRTATTCQQGATGALTRRLDPDAVLLLGDNQYDEGTLAAYRNSYDKSWGSLHKVTYPVPGNHEYNTAGAKGYYSYFNDELFASPGYYAVNVGAWRVYALNSNCDAINCDTQVRWLKRDIDTHPRTCSLFTMHHPRYSSGLEHGSDSDMSRLFTIAYRRNVDLVLSGHDHDYERFKRMDGRGHRTRKGVVSIVSGAGGKSLYEFGHIAAGSAYRRSGHFGVVRLRLKSDRFKFAFKDVNGTTHDRGKRHCR